MSRQLIDDYYADMKTDTAENIFKNGQATAVTRTASNAGYLLSGPYVNTGWCTNQQMINKGYTITDYVVNSAGYAQIIKASNVPIVDVVNNGLFLWRLDTAWHLTNGRPSGNQGYAYVYVPNIQLHYRVYAESSANRFDYIGFIDRFYITVDAVNTTKDGVTYISASKTVYDTTDKTKMNLRVRLAQELTDAVTLRRDSYEYFTEDYPTAMLDVNLTPEEENGVLTITCSMNKALQSYEFVTYSLRNNGTVINNYTPGVYKITLTDDTRYNFEVTATRYYYNVAISTHVKTMPYETLTALLYIKGASIGVGTKPEEGSITFNVFNIYEPGYKDNEFALASFRETQTYRNKYYNTHTLLFEPSAPVSENGDTVTLTGKMTYIQYLVNQTQVPMWISDIPKPAVTCTLNDGTTVLWSVPNTSGWTYTVTPMAIYQSSDTNISTKGYEVRYAVQIVWETTCTITIDTTVQADNECMYKVEYSDVSDYYLDYIDAPSWSLATPTVHYDGIVRKTVSERDCLPAEDMRPGKFDIDL